MRLAAALLVVLVASTVACGARRRSSRAETLGPRAPTHRSYEVLVRTRVSFAGEDVATLRTRVVLFVEPRARGGADVHAIVERLASGGDMAGATAEVDAVLDARGRLASDPVSSCPEAELDDLSPTRIVRHVLGSLGPWDDGDRAEMASDLAELEIDGERSTRRDGDETVVRVDGRGPMPVLLVAGWSFTALGTALARSRRRPDDEDALAGRAELRLDARARAARPDGRSIDGELEIRTELVSHAHPETRPPLACADDTHTPPPVSGDFDVQVVIRLINSRRAAITRCYEVELRARPTLAGRIAISMTIQTSGDVTNVRATENTTGSDAVAACVVRVIAGFHFSPGPVGGSVTYSFPFVFEPASREPEVSPDWGRGGPSRFDVPR